MADRKPSKIRVKLPPIVHSFSTGLHFIDVHSAVFARLCPHRQAKEKLPVVRLFAGWPMTV